MTGHPGIVRVDPEELRTEPEPQFPPLRNGEKGAVQPISFSVLKVKCDCSNFPFHPLLITSVILIS